MHSPAAFVDVLTLGPDTLFYAETQLSPLPSAPLADRPNRPGGLVVSTVEIT